MNKQQSLAVKAANTGGLMGSGLASESSQRLLGTHIDRKKHLTGTSLGPEAIKSMQETSLEAGVERAKDIEQRKTQIRIQDSINKTKRDVEAETRAAAYNQNRREQESKEKQGVIAGVGRAVASTFS